MPKRILSVSYSASLLATRKLMLEGNGYEVASAFGFSQAVAYCRLGGFDLFILGHSIPKYDKLELIKLFRESCNAPVLSLQRYGEDAVPSDFQSSPDDPLKFLKTVDVILGESSRITQTPKQGGETLPT